MCIIIYKPAGVSLLETTLKNSWTRNPDGAGFAYIENGQLIVDKGFFSLRAFKEAYEPHHAKQAILHFRIKTHGDFGAENCHPFRVTQNLVFAHNGVFSKLPYNTIKSDTYLFNELILQNLIRIYGPSVVFEEAMQPLWETFAGSSRVVFMDAEGKIHIMNEDLGEWKNDCWFSNDSWKTPPSYGNTKWDKKKKNHQYHYPETHQHELGYPPAPKFPPHIPAPTPANPPVVWKPFQLGDWVRVVAEFPPAGVGWIGKVMGFYTGHIVEIYFVEKKRMVRIPIMYLDKVTPINLSPEEDV